GTVRRDHARAATRRYHEFEVELGGVLTRFAIRDAVRRFRGAGDLDWPAGLDEDQWLDELTGKLQPRYGSALARNLALEDIARLTRDVAADLTNRDAL